jgi:hypothetical protein
MPLALEERKIKQTPRGLMKANVFRDQERSDWRRSRFRAPGTVKP